eukprot:1287342-Prymnesium_polylepis.1
MPCVPPHSPRRHGHARRNCTPWLRCARVGRPHWGVVASWDARRRAPQLSAPELRGHSRECTARSARRNAQRSGQKSARQRNHAPAHTSSGGCSSGGARAP